MIGAVSGFSPYSSYYMQGSSALSRAQQGQQVQGAQSPAVTASARKVSQPELPVQPVRPVTPVSPDSTNAMTLAMRQGADPVEMAVRMRIQYPQDAAQGAQSAANALSGGAQALGKAVPGGEQALGPVQGGDAEPVGAEGVQKAAEEGQCQTCKERKYQDGSDDAGVSYQTPTHIDPDQAPAAVRGHEQEHVVREQAKAGREDRKVVSQSVSLHTDICPECGRVYVSGGTTRTTTAAVEEPEQPEQKEDAARPAAFSAVA